MFHLIWYVLPKALSVGDRNSSWIINGSRISLAIVVLKCIASLELGFRGTCEGLHHGEDTSPLQPALGRKVQCDFERQEWRRAKELESLCLLP
jgi:hypothetical protein